MRDLYNAQLAKMNAELVSMGALCEGAISMALKAFVNGEKEYIDKVIATERAIDEKESEIEQLCLKLLLKQAPLASDFRTISSVLKLITDLERIGDQAADIVALSTFTGSFVLSDDIRTLAEQTIGMVTDAVDSFVKADVELANAVIANDDIVDAIFDKVKHDIIAQIKNDIDPEASIDVLMIAKYLERIADHSTNIAEWAIYAVTGVHNDTTL